MLRRRIVTALAMAALVAAPAAATQTDPVLEIAGAVREDGASGRLVQIDAAFPADDLVQGTIAVHVLVRDTSGGGTSYLRFTPGEGVRAGTLASLADGLDAADVAALLASGTPVTGPRVQQIGAGRLELWIPSDVALGAAEVQLFVVYEGDPILSNPAPLDGSLP